MSLGPAALELQALGDTACLARLPGEPSAAACRLLAAVAAALRGSGEVWDAVAAYDSLAIYAADLSTAVVQELLIRHWPATPLPTAGRRHQLPLVYDGEDLSRVAAAVGLSRQEVIRRHQQPVYEVAMLGFQGGFPYLLGLDPALRCPRRAQPRPRVTPGSVAIGGRQTGIYTEVSPAGWNLIGRCDPRRCRDLQPGDSVVFVAVDESVAE